MAWTRKLALRPPKRKRTDTFESTVIMACSASEAQEICRRVAREHHYAIQNVEPNVAHCTQLARGGADWLLPTLDLRFTYASEETIVTIVGQKRSTVHRLRGTQLSARTEVILFRDHTWCKATEASVSSRLA